MSQEIFHLRLPPDVVDKIRKMAEDTHRPMEEVMAASLSLMFSDSSPDADTPALTSLTDKQLWMLVHQRLAPAQRERLHDLLEKNQQAPLEKSEQAELDKLLAEVDRQTMLRGEALMILRQRGHDIQGYLNSHPA